MLLTFFDADLTFALLQALKTSKPLMQAIMQNIYSTSTPHCSLVHSAELLQPLSLFFVRRSRREGFPKRTQCPDCSQLFFRKAPEGRLGCVQARSCVILLWCRSYVLVACLGFEMEQSGILWRQPWRWDSVPDSEPLALLLRLPIELSPS